jgi:hypothetical protein
VLRTRALLSNLARLGRSSCQGVLICLQRPDASVLTGEMCDNLGFRVLLGSMSREGVRMCLGSDGADSVMPGHRGTGLVQGIAGDLSTVYQLVVPLATSGSSAVCCQTQVTRQLGSCVIPVSEVQCVNSSPMPMVTCRCCSSRNAT